MELVGGAAVLVGGAVELVGGAAVLVGGAVVRDTTASRAIRWRRRATTSMRSLA